MKHAKRVKRLQEQCDMWNRGNPIGTHVILTKDNGSKVPTRTRSEAQVLSGHSAVIWVDAVSGCYLLDRVETVTDDAGTEKP